MADPHQSWPRKLLAEFAGTFAVVLVALAAAGLAAYARSPHNGPGALDAYIPFAVAPIYGLAYGAAIAAPGRISGGHFNPAVTVAHWVTHRFGTLAALLYIAAQLAGAAAAAYALRLALPLDSSRAPLLGPPMLAAGVTRGPAMLIEAAMMFALVLALWATIVDRARPRYWFGGIVAGVVVAAASYLGAPYTGGAMNPARAFGPALAAHQWAYQPVYWIGPLAGAVAASSLYDLLFRRKRTAMQEINT
jgi:MIP family channel proteins